MRCYIERVMTDRDLGDDLKNDLPDAAMRRRMSPILRKSVATAVRCMGGVSCIIDLDAIITTTGWGCLEDSEKFIKNLVINGEQLLNPTPFIQSTFNTVGAQVALLGKNHCYNMTYVHRVHGFESALLDAMFQIKDCEAKRVLVGAFEERTPTQYRIMERMRLPQLNQKWDGAFFFYLTDTPSENTVAEIICLDFPTKSLTMEECQRMYCPNKEHVLILHEKSDDQGLFATWMADRLKKAVDKITLGYKQIVMYTEYDGASPSVIVIRSL